MECGRLFLDAPYNRPDENKWVAYRNIVSLACAATDSKHSSRAHGLEGEASYESAITCA